VLNECLYCFRHQYILGLVFLLESPNGKVLLSLWKSWWCKQMKKNFLLFEIKATVHEKVEGVLPGKSTNTSQIILDRNRSYLSELQLRRNLAYTILCRLSPTKKWAGIVASTALLLRLILNESDVLVFLVSLSRLFKRFMTDGMSEDWHSDNNNNNNNKFFIYRGLHS
jgi:hypothetical protein